MVNDSSIGLFLCLWFGFIREDGADIPAANDKCNLVSAFIVKTCSPWQKLFSVKMYRTTVAIVDVLLEIIPATELPAFELHFSTLHLKGNTSSLY